MRINAHGQSTKVCGVYVHCQTDLVSRWRQLYDGTFEFDGNRAILFNVDEPLPEGALRHCIAMALTYHHAKSN